MLYEMACAVISTTKLERLRYASTPLRDRTWKLYEMACAVISEAALRLGNITLQDFKVPRDGMRRYFYDIWQPLALLVITASFTSAFFATHDPYSKAQSAEDWFFCNADGKLEQANHEYKPFWDPQLYFTINIALGRLPYSNVKVIDAAWDALVGRGGQFVAAAVAYQTLRQSFTLAMETNTVTISAVVSLYCRQIQLESVTQLIHTMFWHWGSVHQQLRQAVHTGRLRLCAQLFVCIYVLLFTTIVSVMTGYSAQLKSFTGYDGDGAGSLFPVNQLVWPRIGLSDGDRVGLSHTSMFAYDAIVYPDGVSDSWDGQMSEFSIDGFLNNSRDFREPWGVLVDCQWYACRFHSRSPS
jgi:hypothetical protein